jgi:hypothetical protein
MRIIVTHDAIVEFQQASGLYYGIYVIIGHHTVLPIFKLFYDVICTVNLLELQGTSAL